MNSYELLSKVRRLKNLKKKNEEMIPVEELQGKYKKSYEKLCEELKQRQCELKAAYLKNARLLTETMIDSIYAELVNEDIEILDKQKLLYEESGKDPLVKELFLAFWEFSEDKGGKP